MNNILRSLESSQYNLFQFSKVGFARRLGLDFTGVSPRRLHINLVRSKNLSSTAVYQNNFWLTSKINADWSSKQVSYFRIYLSLVYLLQCRSVPDFKKVEFTYSSLCANVNKSDLLQSV